MTQPTKTNNKSALFEIYRDVAVVVRGDGRFQWDMLGGTTYPNIEEARKAIDNWLSSTRT